MIEFVMVRKFVELPGFRRFADDQTDPAQFLTTVQTEILKDPEVGAVMAGTGGLRKFRLGIRGSGKSGGIRVLYVDLPEIDQTWLVTVYAKGGKANLTKAEQNEVAKLIRAIRKELGI